MLYNLSSEIDKAKAKKRFDELIEKGVKIELTEKRKKITLSQNSYLHLILSWVCLETGYDMFTVKQKIFKQMVNPQIFIKKDNGVLGEMTTLRSINDCNTKEITTAIEAFRIFSNDEAGIYIPTPNETAFLDEIETRISQSQYV